MKGFRWARAVGLVLLALLFVSCSKPALYGTLQSNEEVVHTYSVPPEEAFRATKESLLYRGYSLKEVDDKNFSLETYWQPTTADSHYVEVFNRRDYGTVGAYYRLIVKVTARGTNGSRVSITNQAKSIISNLKSSNREENEVLTKVDDFTRRKDIEVTNIGVQ